MPVDSPVRFLVTGKKGRFGMVVKPLGRQRLVAPATPARPKADPAAVPPASPKNYVYMPEGEFRTARGKIEREWAVLKSWKRFSNRLASHTLPSLHQDSLVVAYCQNLRIASQLNLA